MVKKKIGENKKIALTQFLSMLYFVSGNQILPHAWLKAHQQLNSNTVAGRLFITSNHCLENPRETFNSQQGVNIVWNMFSIPLECFATNGKHKYKQSRSIALIVCGKRFEIRGRKNGKCVTVRQCALHPRMYAGIQVFNSMQHLKKIVTSFRR